MMFPFSIANDTADITIYINSHPFIDGCDVMERACPLYSGVCSVCVVSEIPVWAIHRRL